MTGAPSRASFRRVFMAAGPCLLVLALMSTFLYQNMALKGKAAGRSPRNFQDMTIAQPAVPAAAPVAEADGDDTMVDVETPVTTTEVSTSSGPRNTSEPVSVQWLESSYFASVPREAKTSCRTEVTMNNWNGRLGNHIHQILNLVLLAHFCAVPEVHFPKHQDNQHAYSHQIGLLDMPTTLIFPKREQLMIPLKCPQHTNHPYFGNFCQLNTPMWIYHQLALGFVRPYLGQYINDCLAKPEDPYADETLTIHMRADDIDKYPEYSWGQPPCSMYEKILKETHFRRIFLVKKGDGPCVPRLLAAAQAANISVHYPAAFNETGFTPWHLHIFYRDTYNLATDFCSLMRARHLVLSFSTFAVSAALLSTSVQTLYRRREANWEQYLKSPGINCNPWPGVTMYDYGFTLPANRKREGSVEWLLGYPMEDISGPTACTYKPEGV